MSRVIVVSVPLPPEELQDLDDRRRLERPLPMGRGPFIRKLMREGLAARRSEQAPTPAAAG